MGAALMGRFAGHLGSRGVRGYHLAASSFHPLGRAFYRKLGLRLLGTFDWRLHDGFRWIPVTEEIYGADLRTEDVSIARGD
jgi:hypothetical protein